MPDLATYLATIHTSQSPHRQLLVVSGERDWLAGQLSCLFDDNEHSCIWLGTTDGFDDIVCSTKLNTVELGHYKRLLGTENRLAIYNGFSGLRPNALLALAGTIVKQGLMVILCPEFADWRQQTNPAATPWQSYGYDNTASNYIRYFVQCIESDKNLSLITTNRYRISATLVAPSDSNEMKASTGVFASDEQCDAYDAITQLAAHNETFCALISANRGRGKSTLMGILAADWVCEGRQVIVTSEHKDAVDNLFLSVIRNQVDLVGISKTAFIHPTSGGKVEWMAVDNCELIQSDNAMLVVDEAAALPQSVLRAIITGKRQVLMATTTGGYEGTNQGFNTRFIPELKQRDNFLHAHLTTPLRYGRSDPIEGFFNRTCFSDNEFQRIPEVTSISNEALRFEQVHLANISLDDFEQVVALLNQSHYQSSPDDIMRLVESQDASIYCLRNNLLICSLAVVMHEGGTKLSTLANDIASGSRRVKGHLSAQSLALLLADGTFATQEYWRINRIATHPAHRRKGLASQLLHAIEHLACKQHIDWMSTSFANTTDTMAFWLSNHYVAARYGHKVDAASGTTSALMYKALKASLSMPWLVDLAAVDQFETPQQGCEQALNLVMQRRLAQFKQGTRGLTHLNGATSYIALDSEQLVNNDILRDYLIKGKRIEDIATESRLNGKKAVISYLTDAIRSLL